MEFKLTNNLLVVNRKKIDSPTTLARDLEKSKKRLKPEISPISKWKKP